MLVVCITNVDRCHLRQVLEVVAGVRGVEIQALAQQVYRNTLNVFPGLDGGNGMEGEKKERSVVVGVEGVGDGVEAFTLDEDFDYDNVQLSGRKQGVEGWEEFNTGRSFNDYIETAGGEDQLVKQLSKHATSTKTPMDVDKL